MKQLIDKSVLMAEIESKRIYASTLGNNAINNSMRQFYDGMKQCCVDILSTIDTFEVKEVNSTDALIEKACNWLKENKDHPFIGCEDCCLSGFLTDEFIEEFRKAMEE